MKFLFALAAIGILFSFISFNTNDGSNFKTVKIGEQIWMAENLDVVTFRNGDTIPEAKTSFDWEKAGRDSTPAWCYYNNDTANGRKYGKLYNWHACVDRRVLSPVGWHVAAYDEWKEAVDFLGGSQIAGNKMRSKEGWEKNGNDSAGLSILPGGFRDKYGFFQHAGKYTFFWTRTQAEVLPMFTAFGNGSGTVIYGQESPTAGHSCRCIKNQN